ncbi:hypothetical protein O181_075416 [Austropuccinia psidii MF-1]|uniref:Uncharacterized protein n=1 Tax=Austropuccinia psidii MF-1 TaxID=1389203 RepID=A0A9Q3FEK9_9BASI|nr:hypothetical protein [Austropuccinia psidii MF-1]
MGVPAAFLPDVGPTWVPNSSVLQASNVLSSKYLIGSEHWIHGSHKKLERMSRWRVAFVLAHPSQSWMASTSFPADAKRLARKLHPNQSIRSAAQKASAKSIQTGSKAAVADSNRIWVDWPAIKAEQWNQLLNLSLSLLKPSPSKLIQLAGQSTNKSLQASNYDDSGRKTLLHSRHFILGINSVLHHLEDLFDYLTRHPQSSLKPLADQEPHPSIDFANLPYNGIVIIIVCRADMIHNGIANPIPSMVQKVNQIIAARFGEGRSIKILELPTGAQKHIATTLRVNRASTVGFLASTPGVKRLIDLYLNSIEHV